MRGQRGEETVGYISQLRVKEVVNVTDGRRLGNVVDLELDVDGGRLTALVLPDTGKVLGLFGRRDERVIPWSKIRLIGVDVILVEEAADMPDM